MIDLPAVVIEAHAPTVARPLSILAAAEGRALVAHEQATGLRAIAPPATPVPSSLPIDPQRAARILFIEETLRSVRGPLDLGDREQLSDVRARVALAYAEARAHPEDPEAPFLAAEALRTLARVEELAGDATNARALLMRAALLDGGRRIGLSEGGPSETSKAPAVAVSFALIDAPSGVELFVDGERREASASIALVAGEHHLRVLHRDATIVAQWIQIAEGTAQSVVLRAGPSRVACSEGDLLPALGRASFAIGCARWLLVTRRPGALDVRVCGASACAAAATWSTAPVASPPPIVEESSILRSKWTWIGVGAAVVVGGTITAWQLGAFDRPDAPPPTWRWEGVR